MPRKPKEPSETIGIAKTSVQDQNTIASLHVNNKKRVVVTKPENTG